ncbi:RraA family protein (plasmid) [Klebsiella pneumoniae]|uniref:RraA family protein n=1 Tax=Klebsiella pneumoniae complex TaxID=3390273 RepID=UPI0006659030|nr:MULTISPECIES: RraA family protein [Klebsiella]MDG0316316.1 RraA family protein [Klebsiella pneumoniae]GKN26969.1 diguanylate cyclase [Klebsiella variicola]HCI8568246.1 RraA family protein [Klebsiella variicola]
MSETEKQLLELFKGLDTAGVSDALDKLGLSGQCFGVMPLDNYRQAVVGFAYTVRYEPASNPPGTVGDFIDDVPAGYMVVIDNNGRTDCTVWGDIMTQLAGSKGIAGTVIDGVCRDVHKALGDGYPIFTKGRFMRTGKDRVQVNAINQPVSIGTARVEANDIVVADASGVVIVPRGQAEEVARVAHEIEKTESAIRQALAEGKSLRQAREELGYHLLQRKA